MGWRWSGSYSFWGIVGILTAVPGASAAPGPRGTFLYAQKGTKNAPAPLRGWTPRLFVFATSCQAKPLTDCPGPLGRGAFEGPFLDLHSRKRISAFVTDLLVTYRLRSLPGLCDRMDRDAEGLPR